MRRPFGYFLLLSISCHPQRSLLGISFLPICLLKLTLTPSLAKTDVEDSRQKISGMTDLFYNDNGKLSYAPV